MEIDYIKLGKQAEDFKHSALGKYIYARLDDSIEEMTKQLISASPYDTDLNRDIRNQLDVYMMFKDIVEAVINDGIAAQAPPE